MDSAQRSIHKGNAACPRHGAYRRVKKTETRLFAEPQRPLETKASQLSQTRRQGSCLLLFVGSRFLIDTQNHLYVHTGHEITRGEGLRDGKMSNQVEDSGGCAVNVVNAHTREITDHFVITMA